MAANRKERQARLLATIVPYEPSEPPAPPAGGARASLFSRTARADLTGMAGGCAAMLDYIGAPGNLFVREAEVYDSKPPLRSALSQPFDPEESLPPLPTLFPKGRWVELGGGGRVYVFIELELPPGAGFFMESGRLRRFQLIIKLLDGGRPYGLVKTADLDPSMLAHCRPVAVGALEPLNRVFFRDNFGFEALPDTETVLGLPVSVLWTERVEFVGERVDPKKGAARGTVECKYQGAVSARMLRVDAARLAVAVEAINFLGIVHRMKKGEPEPAELRRQRQLDVRSQRQGDFASESESESGDEGTSAGERASPTSRPEEEGGQ